MKYAFAIVYLLLLNLWILPTMAQDKPAHPPAASTPSTAPAAAAAAPNSPLQQSIPIPPARALAIRDAQVEALSAQTQLAELVQRRDAAQARMQQAIRDAYTEAKLKDTEYSIDDRRWVFVPTPKPPVTPAPTLTPTPATGAKK